MVSYKNSIPYNHFSSSTFQDSCRSACQLEEEVARKGKNGKLSKKENVVFCSNNLEEKIALFSVCAKIFPNEDFLKHGKDL